MPPSDVRWKDGFSSFVSCRFFLHLAISGAVPEALTFDLPLMARKLRYRWRPSSLQAARYRRWRWKSTLATLFRHRAGARIRAPILALYAAARKHSRRLARASRRPAATTRSTRPAAAV